MSVCMSFICININEDPCYVVVTFSIWVMEFGKVIISFYYIALSIHLKCFSAVENHPGAGVLSFNLTSRVHTSESIKSRLCILIPSYL